MINNTVKIRSLDPKFVQKGWGSEEIICNNDEYCGKILHFKEGSKFSMHFHHQKHETFYILNGLIELTTINMETTEKITYTFGEGHIIEIPRMAPHQIYAMRETRIIEFSTPDDPTDSFKIAPGDSQK